MKFTLLFYTDDWKVGPAVELTGIPQPGSVVLVRGGRRDEDGGMYYVDNVMYPERGMEREEVIYLYVRPYEGYSEYGPKTETDRLSEKLDTVAREVRLLSEQVSELNLRISSIGDGIVSIDNSVRDKQQEIAGLIDEAVSALEFIKDSMN